MEKSEDKTATVNANVSNLFADVTRSKNLAEASHSKNRNDDFIEFVIGGDSLLPKRVRSKKSDLPYSNHSGNSQRGWSPSGGNNILDGLQE